MKVTRLFLNQEAISNIIAGDLEKINHPVGYAYCAEEENTSCSVFLGTKKGTNEPYRTEKGDLVLNIKTKNARKKGEHLATPEVDANAQQADAEMEDLNEPPPL
jgi:hypothetical protein